MLGLGLSLNVTVSRSCLSNSYCASPTIRTLCLWKMEQAIDKGDILQWMRDIFFGNGQSKYLHQLAPERGKCLVAWHPCWLSLGVPSMTKGCQLGMLV